jgi:hypothetical protein
MILVRHHIVWPLLLVLVLVLALGRGAAASAFATNAMLGAVGCCATAGSTLGIGENRAGNSDAALTGSLPFLAAPWIVSLPVPSHGEVPMHGAGACCMGQAVCHFVGCLVLAPPGSLGQAFLAATAGHASPLCVRRWPDAARELPYRPPRA